MGPLAVISSWALFALGLLLMIFVLFKRMHKHYRRKPKRVRAEIDSVQHSAQSVAPRKDTPLADAPREILRWQVEMHETARELKAELESKMLALQSLIRLADERSEKLEGAIRRAESLGCVPHFDAFAATKTSSGAPSDVATQSTESKPYIPLPGTNGQRQAIFRLADLGQNVAAIADAVGASIGDVELILGSRGRDE